MPNSNCVYNAFPYSRDETRAWGLDVEHQENCKQSASKTERWRMVKFTEIWEIILKMFFKRLISKRIIFSYWGSDWAGWAGECQEHYY